MSDFRARSNAELLDAAFEIYRRHFTIFLAVGVVAALPFALVQYSSFSMMGGAHHAVTDPTISMGTLAALQVALLVAWLVMLFITPFTDAVSVATAARAYRGESVELADAVRAAFARPVAVLLTYWARFFIIFAVGLGGAVAGSIVVALLFMVLRPLAVLVAVALVFAVLALTVIIWKRYFAVIPVLLVEKTRVADAMSRSRTLSHGNGWRIVLLVGIIVVCAFVVALVLGGIAAALASGVVGALLYLLCTALVNQFAGVVLTLLYFDLRIRKEGYDIELLASSLDAPASIAPPDAAPPTLSATA